MNMNAVQFVRVTAICRGDGKSWPEYTVTLLCGLDENDNIADGQWFGYLRNVAALNPFILEGEHEEFIYGGIPKCMEKSNIKKKKILPRELFTVFSPYENGEIEETMYEINTVLPYNTISEPEQSS